MTTPGIEPPEGVYVPGAGFGHEHRGMTMEQAKAHVGAPFESAFGGLGDLLANFVHGVGQAVVGAVQGVVGFIGSLFSFTHQAVRDVDENRVKGERAVLAGMTSSLDKVDEIQRIGTAFSDYPDWAMNNGENYPHIIPLSAEHPVSRGTGFIPPTTPLTHSAGHVYFGNNSGNREDTRRELAMGSGSLELQESGLWLVFFQVAVRQGGAFPDVPAEVWCHVTPSYDSRIPQGPPGMTEGGGSAPGVQFCRSGFSGVEDTIPTDWVAGYGRAASMIGADTSWQDGGAVLFGIVTANLDSAGWKVTLSGRGYRKFPGAFSTFVTAYKVNSETLRDQIDELKGDLVVSLPGEDTQLALTEAQIDELIARSEGMNHRG